jgi:hypothetical protein
MNGSITRWATRLLAGAVLLSGFLVATASPPATAAGTTYYVDAVAGSDTAAGTSPGAAWRSLAKLNGTTFLPGDSILLHKGDTWAGQLNPKGSGTPAARITLSSYGTGSLPKIDGSGLVAGGGCAEGAAVLFTDQEHWVVDGLEVVNDSGVDNLGTTVPGNHRVGICFVNGARRIESGITIVNNVIHDVNGCFICTGYDGHNNGAIVVVAYDTYGASSFDDVYVANNTISRVGRVGIVVSDWSTPFGGEHYYVDQASLSTRVTIRGNTMDQVDGDGIIVKGTDGAVIEHNLVANASQNTVAGSTEPSNAGIWSSFTHNTTMQFNEVYGLKTQTTDGQGFDIDGGSTNTKVQYNYSHDNEGGFILLMGLGIGELPSPSKNAIVRYNLSVNDAFPGEKGVFTFSYGVPDKLEIQNNTIYIPAGSPAKPMYCDGCSPTSPGDWRFRNNIVENHGTGEYLYINQAGAVFDHNLYFGNHPASEPPEPGKLTADPKLVAPGGTTPASYQLQATSPAIGAGTVIQQNGGVDHFGRVLSATAAPSLGFHEGATFAGPAKLIDGAVDHLASVRHTPNITIDASNPASFGGDTARFVRTDLPQGTVRTFCGLVKPYSFQPALTNPVFDACHDAARPDGVPDPITGTIDGALGQPAGAVTWLYEGMTTFSAKVHVTGSGLSAVSFLASPDGRTFTSVTTTSTPLVPGGGGWSSTTITPTASLPAGTSYLLVRLAPTPSWAAQLGQITVSK